MTLWHVATLVSLDVLALLGIWWELIAIRRAKER